MARVSLGSNMWAESEDFDNLYQNVNTFSLSSTPTNTGIGNINYIPVFNYIYFHHTDKFVILPVYPDDLSDSMAPNFVQSNPLLRSAPIYSYSHSGPRTVNFTFTLHRELMYQENKDAQGNTTIHDYIEYFLKELQTASVPEYSETDKMVKPPVISVRIADELFIKGVVIGGVTINYMLPLVKFNNELKYSQAQISFSVTEVDPYRASDISQLGSFRGLDTSFAKKINTYAAETGYKTI